jgi:predicted O-methyltransferase YrrM
MTGALEATNLQAWAAEQVDMAPHIATLTRLARGAQVIVELGVRGGVSTWAMLDGLPSTGTLYSVDIVDCVVPPRVSADPRWTFIVGDDMDPAVQAQLPAAADLVFIDTSHEYEHTVAELAWALTLTPARIVMHDYVMADVLRAGTEFCAREGWRVVANEMPYGLATLVPLP